MASQLPTKVVTRLSGKLKGFQKILTAAKTKDVNESDTCIIITDLLSDLFGYDKYREITTETAIRGTYCDMAITIDNTISLLIEVKAVGLDLKNNHTKQATDYAANKGIEWVVLTNGIVWHIYKVNFTKPISNELVLEFDICKLNGRNKADLEKLFLLTKEGLTKSTLVEYDAQRQVTNKYVLGQLLVTDVILKALRHQLKDMYKGARVELSDIQEALVKNVCKREIFEGEEADQAKKKVQKSINKQVKKKTAN